MSGFYLICFGISFFIFVYASFLFIFEKIKKNKKAVAVPQRRSSKINFLAAAAVFLFLSFVSNVIFSVMLGIVFVYFVWLFRKKKEQDYKKNIDKQIVESIRIFRNVILSGQSVLQAIDTVSVQIKQPLSGEFKRISDRVSLGIGIDEALRDSSLNIQSEQYKLFIDSVRVSNITGAKLSDILDKIEKSINQRLVIYAKVEALTSQGKMSGNIISVVPFFIVLFVYFAEPEMMGVLFTTLIGNIILFVSLLMMLLGSFFMRKISEIDI